jgi:hypothetical protein
MVASNWYIISYHIYRLETEKYQQTKYKNEHLSRDLECKGFKVNKYTRMGIFVQ